MTTPPPQQPPLSQLFHHDNTTSYLDAVALGARTVADHLDRGGRPATGRDARSAAARVAAVDLDAPLGDAASAVEELSRLWLQDTVWFHEPAYAAHLNCPVAVPALLAEVLISSVNASLDTFDQSVGATFIERHLVDWTAGRIHGPDHVGGDGIFTSGGTQSNLQGLLLARDHALAAGAPADRLRILASTQAHFSVQKAARLLGLGDAAVLGVPIDAGRRMDPAALARALDGVAAAGDVPMAVVATAGTTDFGAIDPLPELAALARRHGAWLHVDAAYGGGLLASRTRRHLLAGIEHADSVTVDFHKTWFQPVSASALVVRDGATLRHVTWHADYLNPKDAAHPNQVDKSLQTTRRFDALKLWMTLRTMGADTVGDWFDAAIDLAAAVAERVAAAPDLELAAPPSLSTVVFRYAPAGVDGAHLDALNTRLRAALYDSGRAMVAATKVDGRTFLKLTLLNPRADVEQLAGLLDLLRETGAGLAAELVVGRPPRQRALHLVEAVR
ncbi:pyridoxal phosphate-dependent decarboxylase family protein [Nocardioides solisilvae]|uniref:pyridoxal phosphate-dependent decarboxylase family protein n=1 Tax=Nocardioides solisilvae TaxID=1542435 RepID=UPI001EF68C79|nr:aspartate aminotransferase family protein [Nocardioides solisilvae]